MKVFRNIEDIQAVNKIEPNAIINTDCIEAMKYIADKSIDMIFCDLPYGITRNKWDVIIPFDNLWTQYKRIIKDNGAMIFTATMAFAANLIMSNPSMFRYDLVWDKRRVTGFLNAKRMPMRVHEHILIFYKNMPTYNPQITHGHVKKTSYSNSNKLSDNYGYFSTDFSYESTDRYPKSILEITRRNENLIHPTQKPVELLEYLINTYSNEGDIVLDNCMGSGTTCVAAKNLNRSFIGIEMNPEYFDKAYERIANTNLLADYDC